jgi:hypothetical protein
VPTGPAQHACRASVDLPVRTFHHAVALGVVSCGEYVLDAWRSPHSRRELGSPISCDSAITAKQPANPVVQEGFGAHAGLHVEKWPFSAHLVGLLMTVNRCKWHSEEAGRGLTRSTCTWENLCGVV